MPTLEVTKDNYSMPKLTYFGLWKTVLWFSERGKMLKTLIWALNRISVTFLDLSIYSKCTQSDLIPQSNSFWHAYKKNGVNKVILAWVSGHPLRA